MTTGPAAIEIIKPFESLALVPYLCPGGRATQGYGHTAGVSLNAPACTPEQAEAWLWEDLAYVDGLIERHVTAPLTQNQYDALASLLFNTGPGRRGVKSGIIELKNGGPSTLLKLLNGADWPGAAAEFPKWRLVGGKPSAGLVRRRAVERTLFETT